MSVGLTSNDNAGYSEKAGRGDAPKTGWGVVKPASTFDGNMFFTQVLPRWCPPSSKSKKKRKSDKKETVRNTSTKAKRKMLLLIIPMMKMVVDMQTSKLQILTTTKGKSTSKESTIPNSFSYLNDQGPWSSSYPPQI